VGIVFVFLETSLYLLQYNVRLRLIQGTITKFTLENNRVYGGHFEITVISGIYTVSAPFWCAYESQNTQPPSGAVGQIVTVNYTMLILVLCCQLKKMRAQVFSKKYGFFIRSISPTPPNFPYIAAPLNACCYYSIKFIILEQPKLKNKKTKNKKKSRGF
jgi:hypothetical protein